MSSLKSLRELWSSSNSPNNLNEPLPQLASSGVWELTAVLSEECLSYVAWNTRTNEAIIVDPKLEELERYQELIRGSGDRLWLAVIDTHIHADHVSCADQLARELGTPLVMHAESMTTKADLRVCRRTRLPARAGAIEFVPTPGHTPDGMTVLWGPWVFTGDTVLFGDVGRDDLPGGSPEAHYDSLQLLRSVLKPEAIILPGHDNRGGRASSWAKQLEINSSLTQPRADYISESAAFQGSAPKDFKRSLFENLK